MTNLMYTPCAILSRLFLQICPFVLSLYTLGRLVTLSCEISDQSPITWVGSHYGDRGQCTYITRIRKCVSTCNGCLLAGKPYPYVTGHPCLTLLYSLTINFRSVCSSHVVVMLQLTILSILECNVCIFYFCLTNVYCFYYYYMFTMDIFCMK